MTNPVYEWILAASKQQDPFVINNTEHLHIKINWLLLACALCQGINIHELRFFLLELQKEHADIAALPAPGENLILNIISKCNLKNWSLKEQVPGIIWSVGRFVRARRNRLDLWAANKTYSEIWKECNEIFYMGKTNPLRPKVLNFLFRLQFLLPNIKGEKAPLPSSNGAKRWLIQTKTYNAEETPKEKLKTINILYKELFPKKPLIACHALQFFAEPCPGGYFCQKIYACSLCPVSIYCKFHAP